MERDDIVFERKNVSFEELKEYVLDEIGKGSGVIESLTKYGEWTKISLNPDWIGWDGYYILPLKHSIGIMPYENTWDKTKKTLVYGRTLDKMDEADAYFLLNARELPQNKHLLPFIDECIKSQRIRMLTSKK